MRVMVIVKATDESEADRLPDAKTFAAMEVFNDQLVKAGLWLAGEGLRSSRKGARVRFTSDAREVVAGPFSPTKELIAGYWLWKVNSLAEAIEWAKKCPNPTPGGDFALEVRQLVELDDFAPLDPTGELRKKDLELRALLSQRAAHDAVQELEANLSWSERLADRVASINGSWQFIIGLCAVSLLWSLVNALVPRPFDAYPFVFFNLLLALLVALQGPLIVMSQNRQAEKERLQAAADFQVNRKNEVMIETLLREVTDLRRETSEQKARSATP